MKYLQTTFSVKDGFLPFFLPLGVSEEPWVKVLLVKEFCSDSMYVFLQCSLFSELLIFVLIALCCFSTSLTEDYFEGQQLQRNWQQHDISPDSKIPFSL